MWQQLVPLQEQLGEQLEAQLEAQLDLNERHCQTCPRLQPAEEMRR